MIKHPPCIATNVTDVRLVRFLQKIVESAKEKIARLYGINPLPAETSLTRAYFQLKKQNKSLRHIHEERTVSSKSL